jgi:hypothetical protein
MALIPKQERDKMRPVYSIENEAYRDDCDITRIYLIQALDHADAMDDLLAERDAEIKRLTLQNHCCRQFSDLSGLTVEEIERVGSCGCVQAKRLLERMADALKATMKHLHPHATGSTPDGLADFVEDSLVILAEFDAMKRGNQ